MKKNAAQTVPTVPMDVRHRPDGSVSVRQPTTVWDLLVWAYRAQRVERTSATAQPGRATPADLGHRISGCGAALVGDVMATGMLGTGCSVRTSSWVGRCHPDAERVAWWVDGLAPEEWHLVRESARRGVAPAWHIELPRLEVLPRLRANGRPEMLYDGMSNRAIACLIDVVGVSDSVRAEAAAEQRARYEVWWQALWMLAEVMRDDQRLKRWFVTGIGAERAPWEGVDGTRVAVACSKGVDAAKKV